jgi:hypothetical protein
VTSRKDQKQYWAEPDKPYSFVPAKEFATAFKSFHTGMALAKELSIPFDKSRSHPAALTTTRYGVSAKALLKVNIDREILLMKRNSFIYFFRTFQVIAINPKKTMIVHIASSQGNQRRKQHDLLVDTSHIAALVPLSVDTNVTHRNDRLLSHQDEA